jgi:hypothetical protein
MRNRVGILITFFVIFSVLGSTEAQAYSVLTHQALIDAAWDGSLQPLLKKKFPASTEEDLREAHAYAYGGAIAPDMGYYPYGSELFTNLTHYTRSGDFVEALLKEARTLQETAFALGSLCHYHADVIGHSIGTNPGVALIYPKLGAEHGPEVTYAEDPIGHMRTEFGFDVLQTARGNYASKQYHDFIGFKVDTAVLGRAFYATYGLHLQDVFRNFPRALSTFRWSVAHFFPAITRTAWATRKGDIRKLNPTATGRSFRYRMQRRNYRKEWGREGEKPALGTTFVSFFIRILPKVGPLRVLKFRAPGPQAEKLFIKSFDAVLTAYTRSLQELGSNGTQLVNRDYDTGRKTARGEYVLADKAYDCLLLKLEERHFRTAGEALKRDLLQFYSGTTSSNTNLERRVKMEAALAELRRSIK